MTRSLAAMLAATVLLAAAAQTAQAAAITGIGIVNNSSADSQLVTDGGNRLREFRTESTAPSAASAAGDTVSFATRFAWLSAHRVLAGGPTVALLHSNLVAYDLGFRIEDPLAVGYTLSIDALMRGFLTALWEGSSNADAVTGAFAAGTLMSASLDSGSGFGALIPELTTTTGVATANITTPFVNRLVFKQDSFDAGSFTGTHDFALRFASAGSNTIGAMQNFNLGEADVRFGLDPLLAGFSNAAYPGADGEGADAHGHFLTVTARFNAAPGGGTPLPEPGTLTLLGAAALGLGAARRRRQP